MVGWKPLVSSTMATADAQWSLPIVLLVLVTSSTNTKGTSPHVLLLPHDHWLKSSNLSPLSSRRQELAAPGLHGGDDAGVYVFLYNTPDAYKSNFTLVAVRVFWPEPIEAYILLLFSRVFI
jgi:hypothetical protein